MAQANTFESEKSALATVVFSIGSNYGDRHENVSKGIKWLCGVLSEFKSSSVYATPDCQGGNREYLNAVAYGLTKLRPDALERLCKDYEASCGRDADMRKAGNVPIDIDLVVYEDQILRPKDYKREFFQIGYRML